MKPTYRQAALAALLTVCAAQAQPVAVPQAPASAAQAQEKETIGRVTAQAWLVLLDRRDWGVAWDNASDLFHKRVPLGNWMDAIPKVREPYGVLVDREVAQVVYKTTLPGFPSGGDYVTVIFKSKFDKKADVTEIVTTMREPDGRWRVTGYQPG